MEALTKKIYVFGEFKLDGRRRLLLKGGRAVALNSNAFDLLSVLVENGGLVLSKDQLLEAVWPGQFVEENNLTVHISALRKVFGETKGAHRFILTIPGRGYSFVEEVRREDEQALVKTFETGVTGPPAEHVGLGPIIGRSAEIAEVKTHLTAGSKRLVTLTGAGGSGKTRLARAVAAEMETEFTDGVFFVDLAAVDTPDLVIDATAAALNVRESGGRPVLDMLKEFLRERRILLILDNFEQIVSAAPLVAELLRTAAGLRVLATSREPLRLADELEMAVQPLAVPPRDRNLSVEELSAFGAIELFAVRAREARSTFAFGDENAVIVAEICSRLDGLPLAIELAAARVKLLSPVAILARLRDLLRLLAGGAKDLPSRQRTMRGAIAWSYQLLDTDQQSLFRRLAVFSDGFSVEAAEAVVEAGNEGETYLPVLDGLSSLIEKNLLTHRDLPDGGVRLRMLEVVREFALETLRESGEFNALRSLHAEYFLGLAEEADPHLNGVESVEWLDTVEAELDNFRLALNWYFANDPDAAIRLSAALRFLWIYRNHFTEGAGWMGSALEKSDGADYSLRFKLMHGLAVLERVQGDYEAAKELYGGALEEGIAAGDRRQIASAKSGLGTTLMLTGEQDQAIRLFEETLAASRELDDEPLAAYALICLGTVFGIDGRPAEARKLLEESLSILRRIGSKEAVSNNLNHLGAVAFDAGDYNAAQEFFAEGLELSREVGNRINIIDSLNGFAALAERRRDPETAARLAGAAQNLADSLAYDPEPAERDFCESYLERVRTSLDRVTFERAFEEGRAIGLDGSVALAVGFNARFDGSEMSEIVIERHSYSRIVIEEEIDPDN